MPSSTEPSSLAQGINGEHSSIEGIQSNLFKLLKDARQDLLSQTGRFLPNLNLALGASETTLEGGLANDRKYLVSSPEPLSRSEGHNQLTFAEQVEGVIQLAASLPNESKLRSDINGKLIGTLWNNLQHPPISYLGEEFKYRTADGSNNVSL